MTPIDKDRDDRRLQAAPEDRSFASGRKGKEPKADPADAIPDEKDEHVDKQLDKGLKETFPASDPVSINPGAD